MRARPSRPRRRCAILAAAACLLLLSPRAAAKPEPPDDPAATSIIRAVMQLDGSGLIPFREAYRSALVLAVNASVPTSDTTEITLVAVEEVLPEAGPAAESLTAVAVGGGRPPPQRPPRRALAQAAGPDAEPQLGHGDAGGSPDDFPHVHASLALEPPAAQGEEVERELRAAIASGALVSELVSRGVPATGATLLKMTAARSTGSRGRADGVAGAAGAAAPGGRVTPPPPAARSTRALIAGLAAVLAAAVVVGLAAAGYVGVSRARRARAAAAGRAGGKAAAGKGKGGGGEQQPASPWAASTFAPSVRPAAVGLVGSGGGGGAKAPASPAVVVPVFSGRSGVTSTSGGDGASGSGCAPSPPPSAGAAGATSPAAALGEDVPFSELDLARPIGEGAFGRVYLALWRETAVAVKLLAPRPAEEWDAGPGGGRAGAGAAAATVGGSLSRRALPPPGASAASATDAAAAALLASVRREAALMARLRHPHVVQYLGTVSTPPAVLSEYCPNGSVADVLARAAGAGVDGAGAAAGAGADGAAALPWSRRLGFALGAAKGMLYLHSQSPPLLHRDLKPANLLVDASWRAKVADFNLARAADGSGSGGGGACAGAANARSSLAAAANPRWVAPEVLAGAPASPAADVFSFGVVLWELLTWALPWADLGPWQVVLAVVDRRARLPLPAAMQGEGGGGGAAGPPAAAAAGAAAAAAASPVLSEADLPPGGLPAAAAAYGALIRACWADDPAARPDFGGVIAALRPIVAAQAAADGPRRARAGGAPRAAGAA